VHHVIAYTEPSSDTPPRPGSHLRPDEHHRCVADYDNPAANKYNPDPAKDVKWGDQTWEEMMIGFWEMLVDAPAKATSPQEK